MSLLFDITFYTACFQFSVVAYAVFVDTEGCPEMEASYADIPLSNEGTVLLDMCYQDSQQSCTSTVYSCSLLFVIRCF